jgi:hypothetical protein
MAGGVFQQSQRAKIRSDFSVLGEDLASGFVVELAPVR